MSKCRDGEATTYQMVDHLRYGAFMVARLALLLCALHCDSIKNHCPTLLKSHGGYEHSQKLDSTCPGAYHAPEAQKSTSVRNFSRSL